MSIVNERLQFEFKLKGKPYGGELHRWYLHDIYDADDVYYGTIALGHLNGGNRTLRTSPVVDRYDTDEFIVVETENSYYLLVGEPAEKRPSMI